MAGLLSYIAIGLMIGLWIVGWLGLACIVGAFFDLPMSTSALLGALLGPLGFVAAIVLGVMEQQKTRPTEKPQLYTTSNHMDPFA
jgi:NhaP-type Na+/H+ or K+/H+ antiporter